MPKIFKLGLISLAALIVFSFTAYGASSGGKAQDTQQIINYLIEEIGKSHLTFIRNNTKHTSEEAAAHAKDKYEYFKSRIKTADDFIRLCASKSLLSGKPYMVETNHGVVPTQEWLEQILSKYTGRSDAS